MTTTDLIRHYQDAILRWLSAKRDYPGLYHPEPNPADYGLEPQIANAAKGEIEKEWNRKV